MRVLRKALSLPVFVGVIVGCAATNTSQPTDQSLNEPAVDVAAQDTTHGATTVAEGNITTAALPATAEEKVLATEVLSETSSGVGIKVEQTTGSSLVFLQTQGQPEFQVSRIANPSRLVIDLLGQTAGQNRTYAVKDDNYIKDVRIGRHEDRTRLVFDFKDAQASEATVEHLVESRGDQLVVSFRSPALAQAERFEVKTTPAVSSMVETNTAETAALDKILASNEPTTPAPAARSRLSEAVTVDKLTFDKTAKSSGTVTVETSGPAQYTLDQTTPTEYILSIPDSVASPSTKLPLIAGNSASSGIRSARAAQDGTTTLVRMFVDAGTDLNARTDGNRIVVESRSLVGSYANNNARAQLSGTNKDKSSSTKDSMIAAPAGEEVKPTAVPAAAPAKSSSTEDEARANPTGSSNVGSEDGSKSYRGRLISLDLQDTDIDNALRIIAEVSNLNIIASDDVTGKVTLRLIDVPWDQALDVILKTNGLDQVTEGNVIRIAPVDKLRSEREALLAAKKAKEQLEDLKVKYVRVSYARVGDLKEPIETVLSERGSVTLDERTNQVIVKDVGKGQEQASELIAKLDLRTPQVLLETQIVEAQRNLLRDLGFQWNYTYVASPETGNATGHNFPNSVVVGGGTADAGGNPALVNFPAALSSTGGSAITAVLDSADGSRSLTARLSALETEGRVKVISRPQVATVNNKQAQIKSVETLRVRLPDSGLSVATGQGASASGGGSSAVEEIEVGIQLKVTPQASPDYYVLLDVDAKSSTLGSTVVDEIPSTLDRTATSTVLVKSGQTFALGGVYRINDQDQVQGVPFLKDIPVFGYIFRRQFVNKSDEELIFFITPHIVEGSFDEGEFKAGAN